MRSVFAVVTAAICMFGIVSAHAEEADPVEAVFTGCAAEIENYCSQVTLGEGRLAACFFAHEDKLSGQCQYALYEGAVALEQAINAMVYLATSCESDIVTHCQGVEAGDGRILNCLLSQGENLTEECSTAMEQVEE